MHNCDLLSFKNITNLCFLQDITVNSHLIVLNMLSNFNQLQRLTLPMNLEISNEISAVLIQLKDHLIELDINLFTTSSV
jgi:hypothetical protein